jgi:dipeptidyl-peptidase 4
LYLTDGGGDVGFIVLLSACYRTGQDVEVGQASDLTSTTGSASSSINTTVHEIIWHNASTNEEHVIVSASQLVVEGGSAAPLAIDDYTFSSDRRKVLIFTNAQKVWRLKTRGSYYILELPTSSASPASAADGPLQLRPLRQLGGEAGRSSLMFATFSPDGTRVAYVRDHNIYVEDLTTHTIAPITTDGSPTIINGTFDWVYEEELSLRNGFR